MSLTIDLSASIAATRTTFVLSDDTTYGGDNADRVDVGVFVSAYKMNHSSEATELTVTPNDDDPETDSSWTITYSSDGWYKTYFSIIPDFNSSTTYSKYDAVYDASSGNVYRSKADNNTTDTLGDTAWWEEVDGASIANNKGTSTESENVTSTIYHRVFSANGQYDYATKLSDLSHYMDNDDLEFSLNDYNLYAQWLDAIAIADSRTEVLDGEIIARRIESKFIDAD